MRTDDELTLTIDGQVVSTNGPDFAEQAVVVGLDAASHTIMVDYLDRDGRSKVVLQWRLAGSADDATPIPADVFVPWTETSPLSDC